MIDALIPCPICGGAADFFEYDSGYRFYASCKNEGCPVLITTKTIRPGHNDKSDAVTAWNTRAAPLMKPWVWVHHGPPCGYSMKSDLVELTYKAVVNSDDTGYWATVDERVMTRTIEHPIGSSTGYMYFDSEADAQSACVAFVEHKFKEWLA